MKQVTIEQLLDIGIALSKEKDGDELLEYILNTAMDITQCDGGTLYINGGDCLIFKIMITKSMGIKQGGKSEPITLPPVPLSMSHVCACGMLQKKLINVTNVYDCQEYDFSGPRKYDALTGYKTISMMVVPMEDDQGKVIGVLQLINAMNDNKEVIAFARESEKIIRSLASQAAICLANMNYAIEVEELLNSFVAVMSTAIDARTPYNVNHTKNMVKYGEKFVKWLAESQSPMAFAKEEWKAFLLSIWLHDVGKLTIPLEVMDKPDRLGRHLVVILDRFDTISLLNQIAGLTGRQSREETQQTEEELAAARQLVQQINQSGFLTDDIINRVQELGAKTYLDKNGAVCPYITEQEKTLLSIRKGTLSEEERSIMQSHVVMTEKLLAQIHFKGCYEKVPKWAAMHHELLNGSGYPTGLCADEIPKEVRFLTILDVYDALTAKRPYKTSMSTEQAFTILDNMVNAGTIDKEILELFKQSHVWEGDDA